MIRAEFYNISETPNTLNKTLSNAIVLTGKYFETFDELRPRLEIRWNNDIFNFNYCIINNTAYFIENFSRETSNILNLSLLLDVLQTYKTKLLAAIGTVTTYENANPYISSRQAVHDVRPQFEKINFSVDTPFNENGDIILTTIKGNV